MKHIEIINCVTTGETIQLFINYTAKNFFLKGKTIIRKNVVILRNLCYTNYIYIKGKNKVKIRYDM